MWLFYVVSAPRKLLCGMGLAKKAAGQAHLCVVPRQQLRGVVGSSCQKSDTSTNSQWAMMPAAIPPMVCDSMALDVISR